MPVEVVLETPFANALAAAIQPKLVEVGWGTGGNDDSALAEYIILMLVNGKSQEQIAADISGDLLNLAPEDTSAQDFSKWLFEQMDTLSAQMASGSGPAEDSMGDLSQDIATAGDMDTDMAANDATELNAPTGPRSMRNGGLRGGRDKRMLGHMARAMDRTGDAALHRVRGQTGSERINTHARAPTGPRGGGVGRFPRQNNRAANIQNGLANMGGQGWMMQGQQQPPNQMELVAMLEQQNQMMYQLSQQLMNNPGGNGGPGQQRRGKSLFDRVQDPHHKNNHRRGGHHQPGQRGDNATAGATGESDDMDMGGDKQEASNPEETVCKYNLKCTKRECKFAHQSPAAPPGVTVDISDVCSFGAACKNRKCVGRHPSPATRLAHQSEQDCKFFPNCQNPRCPFKHPSMPLCRNGADCTTPNCKFTHVKTKCKFNPCLNRSCAFAHDEGQQGGFKDKVWTAEGDEHVSERKFVDEQVDTELVKPEGEGVKQEEMVHDTQVTV